MKKIINIMTCLNKNIKRKKKSINIFILGFILGNIFLIIGITILELSEKITIKNPLILGLIVLFFLIIAFYIVNKILRSKNFTDLSYMLDELEKEKEVKESLFHLNHEVKNPLAVVNGYLQMINKTNDKDKQKKYLDIIKSEIKRTITIINDYTELGRIKKLNFEPLDLSLIIEEIKEILTPILKSKNSMIHYDSKDELYILGDYDRLKQVFLNLIKNSIEAKNKDYLIIDIKVKKTKVNYKVSIIDNGIGMTKEDLKHLTESFYTTKKKGTGIGTTFVKKVIEMHQGKIEFKSKEKECTAAIVTLPIMN